MDIINAVGRRKSAVARIYLNDGKGNITVNKKDYKEFFTTIQHQEAVIEPLKVLGVESKYDIKANLDGGGVNGQAQALSLAIARALVKLNPEKRLELKSKNLLRRDPRQVERKKPGRPKARKRFQFSKR
jgi:small subunit ribosomal protein S9